mgnify:CR=1 FL=1
MDRKEYEEFMQGRAAECWEKGEEERQESEWLKKLRRGWYLGGEKFKEGLEKMAVKVVKGRRRDWYGGEGLRNHDEQEANRLVFSGLEKMGLKLSEIRKLKQNDIRKQGLAWLIKTRTVVKDSWIQEKLEMGHRINISRAVKTYRNGEKEPVRKLKRILFKCAD